MLFEFKISSFTVNLNYLWFYVHSIFEHYIVQNLNMKKIMQDNFEVLKKLNKNPKISQRKLAKDLGFSLGKLGVAGAKR